MLSPLLCSLLTVAPVATVGAPSPEPAPADGEPTGDSLQNAKRAEEAYHRGTALYNDAKFEEALTAFQEAATLYASPDFQFNIAKCYERLGDLEEAVRHFELYLSTAADPPDRAAIEASIEMLNQRIEEGNNEPTPEPVEPLPDPGPVKPPGRSLVITGGVLLGVGAVVGIGGGLAFGLMVSRDNNTLGEVLGGNPDQLTFAEADALATQAKRNQTIELVAIGVGGALALTGAALLAVGVSKNKKAAGATARLQLSPMWTRTGAGMMMRGSF